MGVSCGAGEIYVLERGLGGGLDACSGPIAVAHAPVQLSWTDALITPLLEHRVVRLTFLITYVLVFRLVFVRWFEVERVARALACFGIICCSPTLCQQ